ncbi:extracellular solute-binding protein [Paenibacillus hemerocallicola]|uniref:Extracellular solute-binding protein n=1 Tax=Paenibacillus hemerocallicola TaxID=1172614 RepID=A0A5C4SXE6_9BACL|nr:extracellular solute-binding protein [Paenibacillus hemerocallicola]TNJ59406.1 extracellular solute-binding protein [Paenibacillus hemerocallicola]
MKNVYARMAPLCAMLLVLSACGGQNNDAQQGGSAEQTPKAPVKKEPITLSVFGFGTAQDNEFDQRYRKTLEEKFPHITFKYIPQSQGNSLAEMVARGETPDMIRTDIPNLKNNYLDLKLGTDLNELVKKHNYDLSRFNAPFIQEMIEAGRTGALYGLPYPPYFPMVLTYNKSLFDKFGVAYPKDGMSWDEVYELAKKMSRSEGSGVFRGFSANIMAMLRDNPYGYPILDPSAEQLYEPEKWKPLFNNFKRFYELPNNKIEATRPAEINDAFKKGNVAMQANQYSQYLPIPEEIDWDIVSYPSLEDAPKRMVWRGSFYWSIAATSKHKDEAFQVMMAMVSDEVQLADAKKGMLPTVANKSIREAFGKDRADLQKKNMKALFYYQDWAPYSPKRKAGLADVPTVVQQDSMAQTFHDVASNKVDLNTGLRQLDEKLKQELAKDKSK